MPSVSQQFLDDLQEQLVSAQEEARARIDAYQSLNDAYKTEYGKRQEFDKVLDEIIKEARGQNGVGMGYNGGYAPPWNSPTCSCHPPELTDTERHEQLIATQSERIVGLEKSLAAVIAVASFAKHDKGRRL